ncbi:MAG: sigma-70 family RNA polymerase sigma factor [Phycisphaerales bacterium JB065]
MPEDGDDLTQFLNSGAAGDEDAAERAFRHVYERLRAIASNPRGSAGRSGDTLQPTALVHEAYMRLFRGGGMQWASRAHFFGVAARAMRQIAIDHARSMLTQKRGGGKTASLAYPQGDDPPAAEALDAVDLLALDDALGELAAVSPRQAQIVELRFFAGLSVHEVAEIIGRSDRTVELEWRAARAWLRSYLEDETA